MFLSFDKTIFVVCLMYVPTPSLSALVACATIPCCGFFQYIFDMLVGDVPNFLIYLIVPYLEEMNYH